MAHRQPADQIGAWAKDWAATLRSDARALVAREQDAAPIRRRDAAVLARLLVAAAQRIERFRTPEPPRRPPRRRKRTVK